MIRIHKFCDAQPGVWVVRTDQGAYHRIRIDRVHASNAAFWCYPEDFLV
jgi:hypothetical protein